MNITYMFYFMFGMLYNMVESDTIYNHIMSFIKEDEKKNGTWCLFSRHVLKKTNEYGSFLKFLIFYIIFSI